MTVPRGTLPGIAAAAPAAARTARPAPKKVRVGDRVVVDASPAGYPVGEVDQLLGEGRVRVRLLAAGGTPLIVPLSLVRR